ncbi:MAG: hypothetical protein GVY04_02500 [Cyanobacteria bacterium]|jgi:hypothetical protein|nr:hypothetical protein [Cyanobacteria bacterium GSL.Bin1]
MNNYEAILKNFSSVIYLRTNSTTNHIIPIYQSHPVLKALIEEVYCLIANYSDVDWANHFLQILRSFKQNIYFLKKEKASLYWTYSILGSSYYQQFLFCYLQTPSWQAAKKVNFQLRQSFNVNLQYPLEECFVLALEQALNPTRLLKRFDVKTGVSAQSYAFTVLSRLIKHQIAKELKSKSIKLSGYGFLQSVSPTQLEKGLVRWGITGNELIRYRLIWQSFKDLLNEISVNNTQHRRQSSSVRSLNNEQILRLKSLYQDYARAFKLEAKPLNRQDIEEVLDTCLKATQEGERKNKISLDALQVSPSVSEETSPLVANPWEIAFQKEEQEKLTEYRSLILEALSAIEPIGSLSLLLWLGLEINQRDFLTSFGLQKQYQVARQFQRYQKEILTFVCKTYLKKPSNQKNMKSLIAEFCSKERLAYLKSYLECYSKFFFVQILEEVIFNHFNSDEKSQILEELQLSCSETNQLSQLKELFEIEIEKRLGIRLITYNSSSERIRMFIEEWILQNQATIVANL